MKTEITDREMYILIRSDMQDAVAECDKLIEGVPPSVGLGVMLEKLVECSRRASERIEELRQQEHQREADFYETEAGKRYLRQRGTSADPFYGKHEVKS